MCLGLIITAAELVELQILAAEVSVAALADTAAVDMAVTILRFTVQAVESAELVRPIQAALAVAADSMDLLHTTLDLAAQALS
jgi:hypothetical protein